MAITSKKSSPKSQHNSKLSKTLLHLGDPNMRVIAYLIDMILVSFPTIIIILPVTLYSMLSTPLNYSGFSIFEVYWLGSGFPRDNFLLSLFVGLATILLQVIYFVVIPSKILSGQTFGKKILNLKVVKENSGEVTIVTMFERYSLTVLLSLLSLMPSVGFIFSTMNLLVVIANFYLLYSAPKHQTIFDKIAHTVVVEA